MDLLYIILAYERPQILNQCINTLFTFSNPKPDEVWILDDGSSPNIRKALLDLQVRSGNEIPINLVLNSKNYGIGWAFETAYNILKMKNPKVAGFIESDYIWRNEFLKDINSVFQAAPNTLAIPGVDHPDMYDEEKKNITFPDLMKEQFGVDVSARDFFYKPFKLDTDRGEIEVQGVSNTCGCHFLHWERTQKFLFDELGAEKEFWHWMDRAFHKWGNTDRSRASDGHISGTLTYLWEQWAKKKGLDLSKEFCFLDICDASISQHICGGGVNGQIVPEGQTFVVSPHWPENFKNYKR